MPNGSTIINNVRYQKKGSRLIISRTDIRGSGNYHCFARNIVGYERGGSYQLIFYGKIFRLSIFSGGFDSKERYLAANLNPLISNARLVMLPLRMNWIEWRAYLTYWSGAADIWKMTRIVLPFCGTMQGCSETSAIRVWLHDINPCPYARICV